jgi:hypothetical protein
MEMGQQPQAQQVPQNEYQPAVNQQQPVYAQQQQPVYQQPQQQQMQPQQMQPQQMQPQQMQPQQMQPQQMQPQQMHSPHPQDGFSAVSPIQQPTQPYTPSMSPAPPMNTQHYAQPQAQYQQAPQGYVEAPAAEYQGRA